MVQDALIMTLGSVMLTAMWGTSLNGWVICYAWSVFIYGIGVGGEYPMTSTEPWRARIRTSCQTGDRMHRGRKVALSFLMQGWGQLANQAVLIIGFSSSTARSTLLTRPPRPVDLPRSIRHHRRLHALTSPTFATTA